MAAFEIALAGTLARTTRHRLVELIGDDAVGERGDDVVVVSARDQAAMIGILHRLNDLGLVIDRIERL